jgi:hypothetical protein
MKQICFFLLIIVIAAGSQVSADQVYRQVRIDYPDSGTIALIMESGFEPVFVRQGQYIDFAIEDKEMPRFEALQIPFDVIHEDLASFYNSRNPLGLTMGGYRTYSEITAVMDSFYTLYPSLCTQKFSIGISGEGRSLWIMKISDNPLSDENEPEAFVNGLHHAREPIGSEICLEFMRYLLVNYGSDPIATGLVNNYEIYFCPVVNPDGFEYNRVTNPNGGGMWRKNRRNNSDGSYGVDLNRNYSYFWGYDDNGSSSFPGDETYRGPSQASEPEILAMQSFETQHDFAIVVNYHAYGELFLYPWGFYGGYAGDVSYYDSLGAYSSSIGYTVGTPWETLYNTNGDSNDWGYGEDRYRNRSFSTVIEVGNGGDGFWPSQSRIAPLVNENINILKNLLPKAYDTYKRRLPQKPTILSPSNSIPNTQFYLRWQRSAVDTFNLAQSYRVTEKTGYSRSTQGFESTTGYIMDGFARNSTRRHAATYSVYSGQGANLRRNMTLVERLRVQPNDTLFFWAWYNVQNGFDYAYVQISTDGGVKWTEINGSLSTSQNPNRRNRGFGITGSSASAWVRGAYPLGFYSGQEIKVRFYYWTDGSGSNEGIYIDDVFPSDIFTTSAVIAETVYPESLLVGPYPSSGNRWFTVESRDDRGHLSAPSDRFQVSIIGDLFALSGHVGLSDNPADLSGSVISIPAMNMSDTTDNAGNYLLPEVPEGAYDIIASHGGYFPDTSYAFNIGSDTTINFALTLAPPGVPTLVYPNNSAILDTEYVAFDWNDVPGAGSYVLEISSDVGFFDIMVRDSNLTVSNYYNVQPFANGTYYWRVTAHNQIGYSARSAAWVFTVSVMMSAPALLAPPDGIITDSAFVNFDWTDVPRTLRYVMEISRNSAFTDIAEFDSNLTLSAYLNAAPLSNRVYYWRVTAFNPNLNSPRSVVRSFTVNVGFPAPVLLAPPDGFLDDTTRVNFDWSDIAGAASYVFEAAIDSSFGSLVVIDSAVSVSSFAHDFGNAAYFWRVTAFSGTIYSTRSAVRDFEIRTSLAQPTLIAPAPGYISESNLVDFDWSDVAGAHRYVFEVATDSTFANHVINDSTHQGSSFAQAGPLSNGSYFWRVTASNGLIFSSRSNTRSFEVDMFPGISTPELVSPGDGFISTNAFINFDWTDVSDSVTYLFELAGDTAFGSPIILDSTVYISIYANTDSLPNGEFYWRVKATDGVHWSAYSVFWTIFIDVGGSFLPGDANGNGHVNGIDVVYLVAYLKGIGNPPAPYLAGDANGNCVVNGIDVLYLVNYFKGWGTPPIAGDCLAGADLRR